jgi:threonine/homoserine/homoserine lactone efflux protein
MEQQLLLGLAGVAFVTSITPGPNNLMLMASGANFGFRPTLPHMLGVALGFTAMVLIIGLGLMTLFDRWPLARTLLTWVSIGYTGWLAWKIATATPPGEGKGAGKGRSRPMTFLEAAAFQWVNPKAWIMALGAITAFAPGGEWHAVLWVALVFGLVNLPSVGSWALMGQAMRRWLTAGWRLRAFNMAMAGLLVVSMVPVVAGAV